MCRVIISETHLSIGYLILEQSCNLNGQVSVFFKQIVVKWILTTSDIPIQLKQKKTTWDWYLIHVDVCHMFLVLYT